MKHQEYRAPITLKDDPKHDFEPIARAERELAINGHIVQEWLADESGRCICTINGQRSKLDYDATIAWIAEKARRQ